MFLATSVRQKIVVAFKFVWMFIQTSLVSLTNFLNNYSKDYRYVLRVLAKEKKILKVMYKRYSKAFKYCSSFRKIPIIMLEYALALVSYGNLQHPMQVCYVNLGKC